MSLFLTALVVGYSGAMMPGPLLTYDIERSLKCGWKAGLLTTLGHVLVELSLVILLVVGFGRILEYNISKIILFFVGGAALLWFGFDMVYSALRSKDTNYTANTDDQKSGNMQIVLKSGVISILNPYLLLWWATVGLGFLLDNGQIGIKNVTLFYSGHALADLTWYFAVALLCDKISKFIGGKVWRLIIASLGLFLCFFAAKFILSGIQLIV